MLNTSKVDTPDYRRKQANLRGLFELPSKSSVSQYLRADLETDAPFIRSIAAAVVVPYYLNAFAMSFEERNNLHAVIMAITEPAPQESS